MGSEAHKNVTERERMGKRKTTLTLDAHLRKAHACRLAARAWSLTTHARSLVTHVWRLLIYGRFAVENLPIDLGEDAGIGAQSGGDILALDEEADCAFEEAFK